MEIFFTVYTSFNLMLFLTINLLYVLYRIVLIVGLLCCVPVRMNSESSETFPLLNNWMKGEGRSVRYLANTVQALLGEVIHTLFGPILLTRRNVIPTGQLPKPVHICAETVFYFRLRIMLEKLFHNKMNKWQQNKTDVTNYDITRHHGRHTWVWFIVVHWYAQ